MELYSVSTIILLTFSPLQDFHHQEVVEQNIPTRECQQVLQKYQDSYKDQVWQMYICREDHYI